MNSLTTQPQFDLRLPAGRWLFHVETLMDVLDRNEDDVLNLIQLGKLRWAFDISTNGAERREIRIWRGSVEDYLHSRPALSGDTIDVVISRILPKPTLLLVKGVKCETIRGKELERRLSCSQRTITRLIRDGELKLATERRPKISPFVLHASAAAFLKRRELQGNL